MLQPCKCLHLIPSRPSPRPPPLISHLPSPHQLSFIQLPLPLYRFSHLSPSPHPGLSSSLSSPCSIPSPLCTSFPLPFSSPHLTSPLSSYPTPLSASPPIYVCLCLSACLIVYFLNTYTNLPLLLSSFLCSTMVLCYPPNPSHSPFLLQSSPLPLSPAHLPHNTTHVSVRSTLPPPPFPRVWESVGHPLPRKRLRGLCIYRRVRMRDLFKRVRNSRRVSPCWFARGERG